MIQLLYFSSKGKFVGQLLSCCKVILYNSTFVVKKFESSNKSSHLKAILLRIRRSLNLNNNYVCRKGYSTLSAC